MVPIIGRHVRPAHNRADGRCTGRHRNANFRTSNETRTANGSTSNQTARCSLYSVGLPSQKSYLFAARRF